MYQLLFNMAAKAICENKDLTIKIEDSYFGKELVLNYQLIPSFLLRDENRLSVEELKGFYKNVLYYANKAGVNPFYEYFKLLRLSGCNKYDIEFFKELYNLFLLTDKNSYYTQNVKRECLKEFAEKHKLNCNYLAWY